MMTLEELKDFELPVPPWTVAALGEAPYCALAVRLGFFDPRGSSDRPDLDCGPFLDLIRAQQSAKRTGKATPAAPVEGSK